MSSRRSLRGIKGIFKGIKTDQLIFVQHNNFDLLEVDFEIDYIIRAAGNAFPVVFNLNPVGKRYDQGDVVVWFP